MIDTVLPLSTKDHVFTGTGAYEVGFAFTYRGTIDEDRLRGSLWQTLEDFWPLRSHLIRLSEHSYAFQSADTGLVFETAHSPASLEVTGDVTAFLDPVQTVEGEPLTRIS